MQAKASPAEKAEIEKELRETMVLFKEICEKQLGYKIIPKEG